MASFDVVRFLIQFHEARHWFSVVLLAVKMGLLVPVTNNQKQVLQQQQSGDNDWKYFIVPGQFFKHFIFAGYTC